MTPNVVTGRLGWRCRYMLLKHWKQHSCPTMAEAKQAKNNTLDKHRKSTAAEAAAGIKAAATWISKQSQGMIY